MAEKKRPSPHLGARNLGDLGNNQRLGYQLVRDRQKGGGYVYFGTPAIVPIGF
jgi:hypothetical protein